MKPRRVSCSVGSRSIPAGMLLVGLVALVLACAPAAPPTPTPAPKPPAPAAQPTTAPAAQPTAAPKPAAPAPTTPAKPAPVVTPPAPTAAAKPAAPAAMVTIEHGALSISSGWWPNYVALKKGFYEKEGLKVESTLAGSGARAIQALVGGSVHIADAGFDSIVTAGEQGGDVVTIGGLLMVPVFSLITVPDVKRIEDLKGKTLGASSINSGEGLQLKRILIAKGLKESDFSLMVLGGTPERYAGLQKRAIAGAGLMPPQDVMLMEQGYNRLLGFSDVLKDVAVNVIASSRKWAQANPELPVRYLKAQMQAHRWLYDPKNKAEAIQVLIESAKFEPKYAEQTYKLWVEQGKYFASEVQLSEAAMKQSIDLLGESGTLKPPLPAASKFVDLTYWQRAKAQLGQ